VPCFSLSQLFFYRKNGEKYQTDNIILERHMCTVTMIIIIYAPWSTATLCGTCPTQQLLSLHLLMCCLALGLQVPKR
jgi:hypothetical protein